MATVRVSKGIYQTSLLWAEQLSSLDHPIEPHVPDKGRGEVAKLGVPGTAHHVWLWRKCQEGIPQLQEHLKIEQLLYSDHNKQAKEPVK